MVVAPYRADGLSVNSDNTVKAFIGQTTTEGWEFDSTGNLIPNLYFSVGYFYNYACFTHSSDLKGSYIDMEPLVINPRNTGNRSLFFTFTNPRWKGIKNWFFIKTKLILNVK